MILNDQERGTWADPMIAVLKSLVDIPLPIYQLPVANISGHPSTMAGRAALASTEALPYLGTWAYSDTYLSR